VAGAGGAMVKPQPSIDLLQCPKKILMMILPTPLQIQTSLFIAGFVVLSVSNTTQSKTKKTGITPAMNAKKNITPPLLIAVFAIQRFMNMTLDALKKPVIKFANFVTMNTARAIDEKPIFVRFADCS
jgi:hypothetical protein